MNGKYKLKFIFFYYRVIILHYYVFFIQNTKTSKECVLDENNTHKLAFSN